METWLRGFDQFRTLPKELTESTAYGGSFSIFAVVVIVLLFFSELIDFLGAEETTSIVMSQFDNENMFVHFDVTMFALDCDHVNLIVYDAFRETELEVESSILTRTPIDVEGNLLHEEATTTTDRTPPLVVLHTEHDVDQDWDKSSEIIKSHVTFQEVIENHDFTFINFYAEWCSHCRNFAPIWLAAETEMDKQTFQDAEGNRLRAKMLRVNCVEFPKVCSEEKVQFYPNVRFYSSTHDYVSYKGPRTKVGLEKFIRDKTTHSHHAKAKQVRTKGCELKGSLEIIRAPSEFHFQVKSTDHSIVASQTNVSHQVNSLVWADQDATEFQKLYASLSKPLQKNVDPLRGKTYISTKNSVSPQHFIQVVSTQFYNQLFYQVTAQSHMKPEGKHSIPQAKFSYTISPMTVDIRAQRKPFYSFLTSVCALLGGAYTIIRLLHTSTTVIAQRYKKNVGKLG